MTVNSSLFSIWMNKSATRWHWHIENDDGEMVADGSASDYETATKRALAHFDAAIKADGGKT